MVALHLRTGELRAGLPVAYEIDLDRALTDDEASYVHVVPVPLEALATEDIWMTVRCRALRPG